MSKIGHNKEAGATVYLMEELGDARLRCDQLLRYLERVTSLIEKSSHKDHIFEVAGDLVKAVPETAFKLHKALQAVALAADRLDYEEIKQDLRPEKVDELERVLKDVRIRHVQRRSDPMEPLEVIKRLRSLAAQTKEAGMLPLDEALTLIEGLEVGQTKTANTEKIALDFEQLAAALANPPAGSEGPSRARLAKVLRALVAQYLSKEAALPYPRMERVIKDVGSLSKEMSQALSKYKSDPERYKPQLDNLESAVVTLGSHARVLERAMSKAASDEDKQSRFEEGKPADPTENMSPEDAAKWKAQKEEHKDEFKKEAAAPKKVFPLMKQTVKDILKARVSVRDLADSLKAIEADATGMGVYYSGDVSKLTKLRKSLRDLDSDLGVYDSIEALERPLKSMTKSASDEDKQSRFEEGKPADPTKNMSPEDAAKWKSNTDKYDDKFKKEAASWKVTPAKNSWKAAS